MLATSAQLGQTFEVASIRPSGPKSVRGGEGGPGSTDPTRCTYGRANSDILITHGYGFELCQVSSKLPMDRDDVALTATVPAGATKDQFRAMPRNLLAERFHMTVS